MKKNIFKILLFAVMFFSFQINASALNSCANEGKCLVICEWDNTYEYNINKDTKTHKVYLYYYFNGTWEYEWGIPHNPYIASQKLANDIPTKHIFYSNEISMKKGLLNSGNCPSKAYVDVSGMGVSEELCLDTGDVDGSGKTYCHRASNMGTSFKGTSKLVDNNNDQIKKYYTNYLLPKVNNVNCSDWTDSSQQYGEYRISKEKIDEEVKQAQKDFTTNYLRGYAVPGFMLSTYNSYFDKYKSSLTTQVNKCANIKKDEAKKDLNSSDYEDYTKTVDNDNLDDYVEERTEEARREIVEGIDPFTKIKNNIPDFSDGSGCESLLGDPSTEGTPAFYLNVAFNVIKYIAIIVLIVFSVMDFLSATASQDNDAVKKATTKAVKRLIYCVIIFVLPYLLNWLLTFINDQAMSTCGIGTKG